MATNSPKSRDYFITINEGAKCYENAKKIVDTMNYKLYAMITHDKDILYNEDGECLGPKKTHIHIMIELKNPITFESVQNKFEGAHIEKVHYKKSAYQYLLHNLPSAREKYQYPLTDIISNDIKSVEYIIETETFELFQENKFLVYIAEGVRTPYQFVKRFGLNVYRQYWKPYQDMLEQLDNDMEMRNDLAKLLIRNADDLPF